MHIYNKFINNNTMEGNTSQSECLTDVSNVFNGLCIKEQINIIKEYYPITENTPKHIIKIYNLISCFLSNNELNEILK